MVALVNAKILLQERILLGMALVLEQNLLKAIVPLKDLPPEVPTLDLEGSYVAPGFIDLQINGCGGVLFNDHITLETLQKMHQTNLKSGTVSFFPTLITATKEDIQQALEVVLQGHNSMPYNILGIHIEGPFISKDKKGIHNLNYIRAITDEEVGLITAYASRLPIILTLAPEVNKKEHITMLLEAGVQVSLGHTNATIEDAEAAIDLGVRNSTHLFNAMSPISHRAPGVVTAILNHSEVYCGLIADGYHVDFRLLKLVKKLKQEHMYIVTDAAPAAGAPEIKTFEFGGNLLEVKDGKALSKDGVLGGSLITMIESVSNLVNNVGLSLPEAVNMASIYPAKAAGIDHALGVIKPGKIANLVVFDSDFKLSHVFDNGKMILL